jgi:hypothetical protein
MVQKIVVAIRKFFAKKENVSVSAMTGWADSNSPQPLVEMES